MISRGHCSGGGRDFIRVISQEMCGVPRDRVIGSGTRLEYRSTAEVELPINDGPGKPIHIWTRTGRQPLLAGGNADGDVPMLESAQFALIVRHADGQREFEYDQGAEKALAEAAERDSTIVSMQNDFSQIC